MKKETGIKVNIVEGADAEWVSKVEAADGKNVPYDILDTDAELHS